MFLWVISVFFALIACFVACLAVYIHLQHLKYSHIPGPPLESFWLGNRGMLSKEFRAGKHFSEILYDLVKKYGPTFKIFILYRVLVFTVDEEAVKELLVSGVHRKSPDVYKRAAEIFGQRFLGNGLVTDVDEERWSKRRSFMNQAFHRKFLMSLMNQFNEGSDNMVQKLCHLAGSKTEYPMLKLLSQTTLDLLGKVAFGKDIGSLQKEENIFPKAVRLVLEGYAFQRKHLFSKFNPMHWPLRRKTRDAAKKVRDVGNLWMHERLKSMKENNSEIPEDILTYFVILMDKHPDISFDDLLDDFCTFFLAGVETTATLCVFFVMCVNQYPEVKKKVIEEIDSVFGDKHFINYEDLGKLQYMDMVMKETLRLYPPAPLSVRIAMKDMKIGGHVVPADTNIFISTYVSSRLPEFNKDPLKFDPERFAADSASRPSIYTYYPFNLGPRICIGQTFAKIEAKVILSKLYQRMNVHVKPNQSFKVLEYSTLRPEDDLICSFSVRE